MKSTKLSILLSLLMVALVWSCDDDDPEPVNEPEVFTTVNVTFTNTADDNDVIVANFSDLDGEGGDDPVITQPEAFTADATYNVAISFLNETETPPENKNLEITTEDEEHQVFYVASTGLNLTYAYGDQDGNQNPLGLVGTATTGSASTGTLTITLIHEPNKGAAGVADGNPANAGGEVDVEVEFNITIQ